MSPNGDPSPLWARVLRHALLPLLVVAGALGFARWLVLTRPKTTPQPPPEMTALVDVVELRATDERVTVEGMGEVVPAVEIDLVAEVGGRVVAQHPDLVPGGFVPRGAELVRIDPRDYAAGVAQQEAALEKARVELALEEGRGAVAAEEWRRLGGEVETDETGRALAMREPQLRNARLAVDAAASALDRARHDLERTSLHAPFDAVVTEEHVDAGQWVSPASRLAHLVGTARFRVRTSVPPGELPWIDWPGGGLGGAAARVEVDQGNGRALVREGVVTRVLPDLDPVGRMARVLVEVADPLGPPGQPLPPGETLPLNAYARVEIAGRALPGVFTVPRTALREGDRVWLMDAEGRLAIRDVTVLRRRRDTVLVGGGLAEGEQLVTNRIAFPVPGMALRRAGGDGGGAPADR